MADGPFELSISPASGALPLRVPLAKRITTIGSADDADLRLVTVAPHFAVIHCEAGAAWITEVASGGRHALELGEAVELGGVGFALETAEATGQGAIDELAGRLAAVESPAEALDLILAGVMAATGADTGAVILSRASSYTVALARTADGGALPGADELLSDTIVRDVLGSGESVCLTNLGRSDRYARVPSVTALRLRSVLCLPMRVEKRTLGAIFLGKREKRTGFGERTATELRMLAALAVPFLAQLERARPAPALDLLVGESAAMVALRRLIARVAPSDLSLLVAGPSGSGKELVARAIHGASARATRPLVALNCAAVPDGLLGAELFGHKKGAFTGAVADRAGLIESADGSTLFLDEVGDMPLAMQAALLRVLEQREVTRLGENQPRKVDFRLIAAPHRDLAAEVRAGRFREDLRFRLEELAVAVPPLASRGDDVLLLAHVFLRQAEAQLGLAPHTLSPAAAAALAAHAWPGNVRELKATLRRAAVLADRRTIEPVDLRLEAADRAAGVAPGPAPTDDATVPLAQARDAFVADYVRRAVERVGGNREAAARELGIGLRSLYRYLT